MVGAGVGDEAQEICPFSTSTLCGGRPSSPWAPDALCGHGNSVGPECPAPAEHAGVTHSTGPYPDHRDEARSILPSLVTSRGSDPTPSTVGSEILSVPGDRRTWVLCW